MKRVAAYADFTGAKGLKGRVFYVGKGGARVAGGGHGVKRAALQTQTN